MTKRIHHYEVALAAMRTEVADLTARLAVLKTASASLEALVGAAPAAKKNKKERGPASTADCPDHLRLVSLPDRILEAMSPDAERRWTLSEVHAASYVPRLSHVRTTLDRLKEKGKVVHHENDSWGLVMSA